MTPKAGPTWIVVGDAGGSINPFNGEGIGYAYETGRIVAEALDTALATGDGLALQRYPERIDEIWGLYFKVARVFVKAIGNPAVMREVTRVGMHSQPLMEWVLRIMANLLRPDEIGPAEAAYKVVERLVAAAPEPSPRHEGPAARALRGDGASRVASPTQSTRPAESPESEFVESAFTWRLPADPHDDRLGRDLRRGVVRRVDAARRAAPTDVGEDRSLRVRHRVRVGAGGALPGALLPGRADVHRPRRRDHLPVPVHDRLP